MYLPLNEYVHMRQINIFFQISNARQCSFMRFVRFEDMKLFCKSANQIKTISGFQLLQNTWIIKKTVVLLWKNQRKFGFVSYSFSCTYLHLLVVRFSMRKSPIVSFLCYIWNSLIEILSYVSLSKYKYLCSTPILYTRNVATFA
jgi:hypothetical protein